MGKLVIDPALRSNLNQSMELTDPDGRTVGFFVMPDEHARLLQAAEEQIRREYELAKSRVTEEELDAANAEGGEYTTDDVIRHLQSLDPN